MEVVAQEQRPELQGIPGQGNSSGKVIWLQEGVCVMRGQGQTG